MTWNWKDALEHFREEKQGTTTFDYLQAMAEQIEANRKAIKQLQQLLISEERWQAGDVQDV